MNRARLIGGYDGGVDVFDVQSPPEPRRRPRNSQKAESRSRAIPPQEALTNFDISALDSNAAKLYGFVNSLLVENDAYPCSCRTIRAIYICMYRAVFVKSMSSRLTPLNQSGALDNGFTRDADLQKEMNALGSTK
ncbi:MAG: hypothetical protein LBP36_03570 [Oscillospiraceae bacterium]|nr:hypothetical protein [Oscillospiraceae bacterium]